MGPALFLALFVLPFALFALGAARRGARYRSLARSLGARHLPAGPFAPGAIAGEDFLLAARPVRRGHRTLLQVDAPATSVPFRLGAGFFRDPPEWACAQVPATRSERVFFLRVTLPSLAEASPAQRAELLRWLPPRRELAALGTALAAARIQTVSVGEGKLSLEVPGILADPVRIQALLGILRALAPAKSRRAGAA